MNAICLYIIYCTISCYHWFYILAILTLSVMPNKNQHNNIIVLIVKQLHVMNEPEFSPRFYWSPCCSICSVFMVPHCLCFHILFLPNVWLLSVVCLFFDLQINLYTFLTYDPNKRIDPAQRRNKHNHTEMQLILVMI